MLCKHCEKEINENAAFCPFCGTKVEKKLFCVYCGNEIAKDAAFCASCGIPLKKQEEQKIEIVETEALETEETEINKPTAETDCKKDTNNNPLFIGILVFSALSFLMSIINCYMIWYYWFY